MSDEHKQKPCEMMHPTLEAIDNLRVALDCALERRDQNATKMLKKLISEAFATAHAIEDNARKH